MPLLALLFAGPEAFRSIPVMSDPVSAFGGVVVGVVLGAIATYVTTRALTRREHRRVHQAAVRAVLYELSADLVVAQRPTANGTGSTAAYDAFAIEFFGDLPSEVGMVVSAAYAQMHTVGFGSRQMAYAKDTIKSAQIALFEYVTKTLKLKFELPPPPG